MHPRFKARAQYAEYMKQSTWGNNKDTSIKANTYIKRNTNKELADMFTCAKNYKSLVQKAMSKSSIDILHGKQIATYISLLKDDIATAENKLEEAKQAIVSSSANVVNLAIQGKISQDKYDQASSAMDQEEEIQPSHYDQKSPSTSYQRPRGSRASTYNHIDVVNPSDKDFKRKNVIGWHLVNAALLKENNVLDKFESGHFSQIVSSANNAFEEKRIKEGRGLAQEVIEEYLVENGLPVEEKYFVYKAPMTACLFGADMDPLKLNPQLPSNLFKTKTLSSSVIGTLAASVERTYSGCMEGLRMGETKGPHKTRFFFFV